MGDDVTALLKGLRSGDKSAESELVALVYRELKKIASRLMRKERPDHTLQTTALVNEAYIRLVGDREVEWHDRAHFYGVAAQVMRHILVDYARQRLCEKRGGGAGLLPLDEALVITSSKWEDLLALEAALERLEREDPRVNQVVVFRFFGGLSVEEVAEVLKISARTVKRDWNYGRAWLRTELAAQTENAPEPS